MSGAMPVQSIEWALRQEVARLLALTPEQVDPALALGELGIDSVGYVDVVRFIQARFGVPIKPETLFEHNSIHQTAAYIAAGGHAAAPAGAAGAPERGPAAPAQDIAIIGLALRLPGACSLDKLWDLVLGGACQVSPVPASRWAACAEHAGAAGWYGGLLDEVARFDAAFFGISPREALAMDPQQRLLLECAWHAFEAAGYSAQHLAGSDTAVFVGASSFDYYELLVQTRAARTTHIGTGVSHAILANRLSQYFNLRGASEAIDTACSSSLVALWRSVQTLRRGESQMALVGGVNVFASPTPFQAFAEAGMLSLQGRCLPFDAAAAGYVRGEGVVCLVLKLAAAARQDGDRILAVIKGGAVRHSGRTQSLTAPNPEAQADIIAAAVQDAGVDPLSIGYVETHGTGTALGDPIEIQGLKKAFARLHAAFGRSAPAPHCCLGSLKAQIGHLEAAAGLAGVAKTVAVLQRGVIPGNPYLQRLNTLIDLADTVFRLPVQAQPWDGTLADGTLSERPRRAGVSSFGFGGTNAHVVLEEAPAVVPRRGVGRRRVFLLSARRSETLRLRCQQLAAHLASRVCADTEEENAYLEDVAFTLWRAHSGHPQRLAWVAATRMELVEKLQRSSRGELLPADDLAGDAWAQAWLQGAEAEACHLSPHERASIVALPPYPFAGESFWPQEAAGTVPVPSAPVATEVALWTARWTPAPAPSPAVRPLRGPMLAIVGGPRGDAVAQVLARMLPACALQTVTYPAPDQPLPAAAVAVLGDPPGTLGAVVDLSALDGETVDTLPAAARLEFLRHLVGGSLKRGAALRVLQATRGVQDLSPWGSAPTSLAGAALVGVYENLGAEYKRCHSMSVDFAGAECDLTGLAGCLAQELRGEARQSRVAYAGGQRYTRTLVRLDLPAARESGVASVALITGGTGDIGLYLARSLAEGGCRALLLTGRRALMPDKEATLRHIAQCGTAVAHYRGALDDEPSLRAALADFTAQHGRVTHVFHCAGTADAATPAFYQKTATSMGPVFAPKVDTLTTLHKVFADDPPRAFVLFSSASAVLPRLAAGALDYSAANRYMDLFAQYQHAQGRSYYCAMQWTRWHDLGLAHRSPAAGGSGMPLAPAQCLEVLSRLLAAPGQPASVCVLAAGESVAEATPEAIPDVTLQVPQVDSTTPAADGAVEETSLRHTLRALVARELEIPEERLEDEASFEELGIDSIVLTGLIAALEQWLGQTIEPQALIRCNSLAAVACYLAGRIAPGGEVPPAPMPPAPALQMPLASATGAPYRVAVIGIACHFPGAPTKEAFWHNLAAGVDSVGTVPPERWHAPGLYADHYAAGKSISCWGGFIEDIEWVYPKLFDMSAAEAADVDPLTRLFTACSLTAIADARLGLAGVQGKRVGVFAGARASRYAERIDLPGKRSVTGIGQNFIAAYVSHVLDLHGPNLVLDCACSSSLAAVHLACQSLRNGDSELALAGGVEVLLDEKAYLFLSAAHALSPDGRCRPFSAQANGFVPGEGVGCVLLKPLERALADGDPIYAVIEGSAINNDGHTLGITTPGSEGQEDVIRRALGNAGVQPRDISYVETHGTGTLIGDPIELQALARAFQAAPPEKCALGSVKSNVGHLLSAAGIASFIKVALALHHRILPPTLHCAQVNPRFDFEHTPFFPVQAVQEWSTSAAVRRAGISAFGFGKTNVHMIVAERSAGAVVPAPGAPPALAAWAGERVVAWHAPHQPGQGADRLLLALEEVTVEHEMEPAMVA